MADEFSTREALETTDQRSDHQPPSLLPPKNLNRKTPHRPKHRSKHSKSTKDSATNPRPQNPNPRPQNPKPRDPKPLKRPKKAKNALFGDEMTNPVDTYNYPGSFQSESEKKICPKMPKMPKMPKNENSKILPTNGQISDFNRQKAKNFDLEESENFILSSDEKFTGRSGGCGSKRREVGYGLLENVSKLTGEGSEGERGGRSFEEDQEVCSDVDLSGVIDGSTREGENIHILIEKDKATRIPGQDHQNSENRNSRLPGKNFKRVVQGESRPKVVRGQNRAEGAAQALARENKLLKVKSKELFQTCQELGMLVLKLQEDQQELAKSSQKKVKKTNCLVKKIPKAEKLPAAPKKVSAP